MGAFPSRLMECPALAGRFDFRLGFGLGLDEESASNVPRPRLCRFPSWNRSLWTAISISGPDPVLRPVIQRRLRNSSHPTSTCGNGIDRVRPSGLHMTAPRA